MVRKLILPLGALLLASCAPSLLYVQNNRRDRTYGEVPRDGRGEPIWSAVPGAPPPPQVAYVPPAAGIPVTGPGAEAFAPPPPPPSLESFAPTREERRRAKRACLHLRHC